MASVITATTTSGLTQSADNSGVLQLASGAGNLVTIPSVTGTAMVSGNMPAFSAYISGSNQSVTAGVTTKVRLDAENFDTNNNFDPTTNYRFTPNVAGYYLLTGSIYHSAGGTRPTTATTTIYVSGAAGPSSVLDIAASNSIVATVTVTRIVYFNGTTDYAELYGSQTGGSSNIFIAGSNNTYFSGVLVRAA